MQMTELFWRRVTLQCPLSSEPLQNRSGGGGGGCGVGCCLRVIPHIRVFLSNSYQGRASRCVMSDDTQKQSPCASPPRKRVEVRATRRARGDPDCWAACASPRTPPAPLITNWTYLLDLPTGPIYWTLLTGPTYWTYLLNLTY
jgi:hypothetical protein